MMRNLIMANVNVTELEKAVLGVIIRGYCDLGEVTKEALDSGEITDQDLCMGYTEFGVEEIAKILSLKVNQVKGVVGSLQKKDLVAIVEDDPFINATLEGARIVTG